jgi:hypothetical protein
VLEGLELDIDAEASNETRKLARTLHEFEHYIRTNRSSIPDYGDRYRKKPVWRSSPIWRCITITFAAIRRSDT